MPLLYPGQGVALGCLCPLSLFASWGLRVRKPLPFWLPLVRLWEGHTCWPIDFSWAGFLSSGRLGVGAKKP